MSEINFLKKYEEQWMYLLFGGLTTLVNWFVYVLLFKMNQSIEVANIIACVLAIIFAYITNRKFVFKSQVTDKKGVVKEVIRFVSCRGFVIIFEIAGVPIACKLGLNQVIWGVEGLFAKIVITILVVLMNYLFSKMFVFKG